MNMVVELENGSSQATSVQIDFGSGTATGGADYSAQTAVQSFDPGVTEQIVR